MTEVRPPSAGPAPMASNRSSTVAATRLCDPIGSAIEMPCAAASAATRSVIRPCARNQGAITRRSAPSALKNSAASATPGCGPVADPTCVPAQRVPAFRARATVAVRALAASLDEPTATTITPRPSSSGDTPLAASRCPSSTAARDPRPARRPAPPRRRHPDHRGDVDPGMKSVGQQERHRDGIAVQAGQHVAQARVGSLEKRGTDFGRGSTSVPRFSSEPTRA